MINIKSLTKEDRENISELQNDLKIKLSGLNSIVIMQHLENPVRIGKSMLAWKIKDKHKYYFYDEFSLIEGVKTFFSNPYIGNRLAKDIYCADEDEIFTEAMDVECLFGGRKGLGEALDEAGVLQKTSTIEFEFKALDWQGGAIDRFTSLPVTINAIRLIPNE